MATSSNSERKALIQRFPSAFVGLYGTRDIQFIIDKPMESRNINGEKEIFNIIRNASDIYQETGMAIPPNMEPVQYIVNNRIYYDKPLSNKIPKNYFMIPPESRESLGKYSDRVLISILGGYPCFNNRPSLVEGIESLFTTKGWFVLLYPRLDRVLNKGLTTTFLSTVDDLDDETIFAYGTARSYHIYESEELEHAIIKEEKMWKFTNPQGGVFAKYSLQELSNLAQMTKYDKLSNKIQLALRENTQYDESDFKLRDSFESLNSEDKDEVRQFLLKIFDLGMYCRRWKGPGHPYPIKQKETTSSKSDEYHVKITEIISEVTPMFANPVIGLLKRIRDQRKEGSLLDMLNSIKNGSYCIRMASKRLIETALHYRLTLFREKWPGINLNEIDHIL